MSLAGEYDAGNVFALMLAGQVPCIRVFEDDVALAFMDIFPQTRGHTLVIPKVRARHLLDFPPAAFGAYMERVHTVAHAVARALSPDGVTLTQFSGAPAGQSVFHMHFHILPRWSGVALGAHGQGKADPADLEALAKLIRAAF